MIRNLFSFKAIPVNYWGLVYLLSILYYFLSFSAPPEVSILLFLCWRSSTSFAIIQLKTYLLENLFAWTFENWYNTVVAMFVFFNILYWGAAYGGKILLQWLSKKKLALPVDNHALYPGQERQEVRNSLLSITVFSLQGIFIQQGIQHGWLKISYDTDWYCVPQMFVLFLWNEIHFYFVHRLLHTPALARRIHSMHHHSKEPTVFSTFSFHWAEAFLLGTVIVVPLAIYPFQLPALIFLPVMSIILNTLGHCNYELFPGGGLQSFFQFSNRHSMHHKKGSGNYGFMLSWFDGLFHTAIAKKIEE